MKQRFVFILACIAIMFMTAFSCTKQDTPEPEPKEPTTVRDWFEIEGIMPHYDSLQFERKVAYIGGAGILEEAWIRARSGEMSVSDPSEAEIVILGDSHMSSYESDIAEAYSANKVIIACNPDLYKIKLLHSKYKWSFILPGKSPKTDYALCFCRNHTYILLAPVHIMTSSAEIIGEDQPEVIYLDGEKEYEGHSIFSHLRGLNQFIKEALDNVTDQTRSSISAGSLSSESNTYSYNIDESCYWDTGMSCCGGDTRYFRFFSSCRISYSIYPCHTHGGDQTSGTDYYTISAVASNYAPTAYEYSTDPNTSVSGDARYWTGKGDKSYWGDCQFMGPYNSKMTFKSHAATSTDLEFTPEGVPDPATAIDCKNYSSTEEFSWNVGMSGGVTGGKETCLFNMGAGGKKSNSVSYSVSDLSIVNSHNNNNVDYQFNYGNVPEVDSDFDNFDMPNIANHTGDFAMAWQWTAKRNDGDTSVISLVTEVSKTVCMWTRDKVSGSWGNSLFGFSFDTNDTNSDALYVAREPIGCMKINNQCSNGNVLYDIVVKDGNGQTVFSENQNSIYQGEYVEILLPQRNQTYGVYLNMGKSRASTMPYYSTIQDYTLEPMDDPDADKRILNISEDGIDFSTNIGVLRVKNQSATNLIMNLAIHSTDGTVVHQWPNSIGLNETAEMKLTANAEYYATMDYGSLDSSKPYQSNTFNLPSFSSESDVKALIATNGGGDFFEVK